MLSIIVPTKDEAGNIVQLVGRIEQATNGTPIEVVFVDDSSDETPEVIRDVCDRSPLEATLIVRPPDCREGGLGSAVVEGIRASRGRWICVMDGDLQHPPELIPQLLAHARETRADIVVGSRFAAAGCTLGLGWHRFAISLALNVTLRAMFPGLQKLSDPLTGFFLVRREAVDPDLLRPHGFKILLEILVRFPGLRLTEIPFEFGNRHAGQSKASLREGFRFLRHLLRLRLTGDQHFIRFLAVGASGLVVNSLLLAAFTELVGFHYLLSAGVATQGSSLWNFGLTEIWVFGDRRGDRHILHRLGRYLLMNNVLLLARGPLMSLLVSGLGVHYVAANLISLFLMTLLRYLLSDQWIWTKSKLLTTTRRKEILPMPAQNTVLPDRLVWKTHGGELFPFAYDVHGVVRVESMVRLPELDYFRTSGPLEGADVRVRLERRHGSRGTNHSIRYDEGLGRYGFEVTIAHRDRSEVAVSPVLRSSPHVLYTNVIEPILRWTFVRKGYALIHAACVSFDGRALLVTARTDTGKTTTILHSLTHHCCEFLSDDMTILGRDGRVMSYPKPLTISQHTLQAVDGGSLSLRERLALQVQSRLHSRSGRRIGLGLGRTGLPTASLNAVVQMLIPPPKYMVDRLIPGASFVDNASLAAVVLIERGPDLEESLNHGQAVEMLVRNAEDAYGFPPYPALAGFLSKWDGEDLRDLERGIISEALNGCSVTRLRDPQYRWWQRLPALIDVPAAPAMPARFGFAGAGA